MLALLLIAQLAATDVPCTVPVPAETGEWKQVSDASVTFCVPSTWRIRGTRAIYSGGNIQWQHNAPPVQTRSSSGPSSIGSSSRSAGASAVRTESFPEVIGGAQAEISWQTGVGRLQSRVSWRQPLFSMVGEAAGESQLQIQLAVYRTVRFKE